MVFREKSSELIVFRLYLCVQNLYLKFPQHKKGLFMIASIDEILYFSILQYVNSI